MYSFRFLFHTTVDVFSILNPEGQLRLSDFKTKLEKQGWDGLVQIRIRATHTHKKNGHAFFSSFPEFCEIIQNSDFFRNITQLH